MTLTKTRRILATAVAALSLSAVGLAGVADAQPAQPKLTIHYNGDGFEGKVKDKSSCLANRTVQVHKASSGKVLYMDTTESNGSWNTGNSGQTSGKFYATVNAKGGCLPLVSKTITA